MLGGVAAADQAGHQSILKPVTRAFATHQASTLFAPPAADGGPGPAQASYPYALHAYVVSSDGARALESLVATHGFRQPAAKMLAQLMPTVATYVSTPLLLTTAPVGDEDDSDVQYDYTAVPEPGIAPAVSMARPAKPVAAGKKLVAINTLAGGLLLPTFVIAADAATGPRAEFNVSAAAV